MLAKQNLREREEKKKGRKTGSVASRGRAEGACPLSSTATGSHLPKYGERLARPLHLSETSTRVANNPEGSQEEESSQTGSVRQGKIKTTLF